MLQYCISENTLPGEYQFMWLPKPVYEGLPYFLVAVGILFVTLVLQRYEHAPTLFIWLLGVLCILAGVLLFATRLVIRHNKPESD